jgi:predicted PurR-regulated permease PerM
MSTTSDIIKGFLDWSEGHIKQVLAGVFVVFCLLIAVIVLLLFFSKNFVDKSQLAEYIGSYTVKQGKEVEKRIAELEDFKDSTKWEDRIDSLWINLQLSDSLRRLDSIELVKRNESIYSQLELVQSQVSDYHPKKFSDEYLMNMIKDLHHLVSMVIDDTSGNVIMQNE